MPTPVKDFWTKDADINAKEFEFGYTEQNKKKRRYRIEQIGSDKLSFQTAVFIVLDTKKKSHNPWIRLSELKKERKIKITNLDDEAVQTELWAAKQIVKKFISRKK